MSDRPAALDGLLDHIAATIPDLPDEEAATAKARAAMAPLEKQLRAAKAQERAELRGATLASASEHLRTTLFHKVYDDAGQRTAEGVARAADELLRLVADPNVPTATWPSQRALDEATRDVPIAISLVYAVRGRPEIDDEYNETRTIAPTEITLTYRSTPDSQLGRVHAYVKGWWMLDGARVHAEAVGRHFTGDLDRWPKWLAAEARLHDPGQPS
ncbi:hypothetical protein OG331_25080 [Streptomyces sp. NBC_01017]|uniref:hypothetical protein n=1 Tax=Streptomyces sp. NBC_01017 TaxID=2903721 RepID=UPI003866525F|nr:hypothetical protein OG331_25080 [Streptomyces sp. NBC_01017]